MVLSPLPATWRYAFPHLAIAVPLDRDLNQLRSFSDQPGSLSFRADHFAIVRYWHKADIDVHFEAIDAGQLIETILGLFWQTTKEYGYRLRAKSFVRYGAIKYALISEGHVLYVRVRR